jgi:hypothetical protein
MPWSSTTRSTPRACTRQRKPTSRKPKKESLRRLTLWEGVAEHLPALDGPGFRLTELALECADGKPRYPYPDGLEVGVLVDLRGHEVDVGTHMALSCQLA